MVTAESLAIGIVGVLLALVSWAFSKIFDRTTADISALREEVSDLHARVTENTYRLGSLEKTAASRRQPED